MIGYVETYRALSDAADTSESKSSEAPTGSGGVILGALFKRMDRNGDGKLTSDEIPEAQRPLLMRLDTNKDGSISLDEAERLKKSRNRNP